MAGRPWTVIEAEIFDAARQSAAFAHYDDNGLRLHLSAASDLVQSKVLDAVRDGDIVPPDSSTVTTTAGPYTAIWEVATDVLRIGNATDYVRPNVSQLTSQQIADALGGLVTPALVLDATVRSPASGPPVLAIDADGQLLPRRRFDGTVGLSDLVRSPTTAFGAMVEESQRVDQLVHLLTDPVAAPVPVMIGGHSKAWIPDFRLAHPDSLKHGKQQGCNYQLSSPKAPDRPVSVTMQARDGRDRYSKLRLVRWNVFQPPGLFHPYTHTDYSQRGPRLMSPIAVVSGGRFGGGQSVLAEALANDADTAPLLSYSGKPMTVRHPWIPPCGGPTGPANAFGFLEAVYAGPTANACPLLSYDPGKPLAAPRRPRAPWAMMAGGAALAAVLERTKR